MNAREIVLTALTPGEFHRYTPVQVQKLLFLIDRQIPDRVEGPHFHFEPYHYGPFDRAVYDRLDELAEQGLVHVDRLDPLRAFTLTPEGVARGNALLATLAPDTRAFIVKISDFVRCQSFSSLVSAIYKAFPDMRVNSVFQR